MAKKQLVYGINDCPPGPILVLAGAQHVLTLFGATTLVPLVLGPAMGMSTQQIGAFIGCVYFSMGIATLIQTWPKLGSGLPIVQGSSFSFIPPIMTIIGAYKAMGPGVIMQYLGGSLIVGGVALSLLGYSKLVGLIRKLITPVVIGPTIMAIGFSRLQQPYSSTRPTTGPSRCSLWCWYSSSASAARTSTLTSLPCLVPSSSPI